MRDTASHSPHVTTVTLPIGEAATIPVDLRADWLALRASNPDFASPYLHPDYVEAVAATSPDPVQLILATHGGSTSAILPVQGGRSARPVGAPMSDYHALIGAYPGGVSALLSDAGRPVMGVGGLIHAPDDLDAAPVCRIDLSGGYEAWRKSRDSSYSRHAKSHRRRVRKATEDIGTPRFDARSRDVDVFNQLVEWKRDKFARTGKYDVLSGWPRALIRRLWEQSERDVRADMHALYFGDRLAAVDLGLTDGPTFHSWMVAYDPDLATYGPGIQLLEALMSEATELGYDTLDLGVGLDGYKRHYANVDATVGMGVIRTSGPRAAASRVYGSLEDRIGPLARLRRRYTQIAACEPRWTDRARHIGDALRTSSFPASSLPASPLPSSSPR